MGLRRCCAVVVGIACLAPGTAAASHQFPGEVTLGNGRAIHPTFLDINPGETVTWRWAGPDGDTNHTTTAPIDGNPAGAEFWESNPTQPDPNDVVDSPVGREFTNTFDIDKPGTYFYGCRVHDEMRATIRALGIPTAVVTASPTNPLTGQPVTFDGGGSFDGTSGTIANYAWDLDNDGLFGASDSPAEPTGPAATTQAMFDSPGPRTVGLRVTDGSDDVDTATVNITVRSRVPVASFTVSLNPREGQAVTFTSNSMDADNDTLLLEWDLDNDGLFGANDSPVEPTGATVQRTYPVGPQTVGLKVTDDDGTSTTTRNFTVQNQAPTASFTATPGTVMIGETVAFDGRASNDVVGPIVNYEWDLDGDNVFEISGANASPSRSYSGAGTVTTRLRVTDDEGGVSPIVTRPVTVNAPASTPPPQDPPPAESPPPVLPAPSIGGGSTPVLPPAVTLAGPARQRALRQRGILVTAGCDRACTIATRGTVNVPGASKVFRLRPVTRRLGSAGSARIKLTLPRAAQKAIRSALRRRKRVTATITVAATDASGSSTKTRRIRLIG